MSSLKRKHLYSSDDSDHDNPADQPFASRNLTHPKRRRFDLTRNLSQLSLFEQTRAQAPIKDQAVLQENHLSSRVTDQDVNISFWSSPYTQELSGDTTMDLDAEVAIPVTNHPIVEEPPALTIPEVRMRHSSSYEPEKDRIIITDLDSSEDEADSPLETSVGCVSTYSVSHAFLSRVNRSKTSIPLLKPLLPKLESDSSQALVLFRPSPWSAKDAHELEEIYRDRDEEKSSKDQLEPQVEEPYADGMEIE